MQSTTVLFAKLAALFRQGEQTADAVHRLELEVRTLHQDVNGIMAMLPPVGAHWPEPRESARPAQAGAVRGVVARRRSGCKGVCFPCCSSV